MMKNTPLHLVFEPSFKEAFPFLAEPITTIPHGDGHINDTYRLSDGKSTHYILQRINTEIFKSPQELMDNVVQVTDFLHAKGVPSLTVRKTAAHVPYYKDQQGGYWRLYDFIAGESPTTLCTLDTLRIAGQGFGDFLSQLSDFPARHLHPVIPDFHNTPLRYANLKAAYDKDPCARAHTVKTEFHFASKFKGKVSLLVDALEAGRLPLRVTHNDTKVNNVLIDPQQNKVICVVDLDTLMPGSALYDYGDGIRSCVSTAPEDALVLADVSLDLERFYAFTEGFLKGSKGVLTAHEIALMPMGALLMTLECGMRFLTDYLEGDLYFKTQTADHNLRRARTQFKLVHEMSCHYDTLIKIVQSCTNDKKE